jgi:hypothetical protein
MTQTFSVALIALALLLAAGCQSDCRRWCNAWSACQLEQSKQAGLGDVETECRQRCETVTQDDIARAALSDQLVCLNKNCKKMEACVAKVGQRRPR